jgi:hypothetical protein
MANDQMLMTNNCNQQFFGHWDLDIGYSLRALCVLCG